MNKVLTAVIGFCRPAVFVFFLSFEVLFSGRIRMSIKRRENILLIIFVLLSCGWVSTFVSNYTCTTDFPVFYCAASKIIDPNTPNETVYETDPAGIYNIPESRPSHFEFIYSMLAAYIMAPLALLPYFSAKAVMIFTNIVMYLGGVAIALHLGGASGRRFFYPLAFSFLWLPFIQNLRFAQVNAMLLFLVSVAVLAATKNRPTLCGILLGVAALFKLFPLAIAFVLGLKNWRILAAFIVVLAMSFLVPGSFRWFPAISKIYPGGYTPIYLWLKEFGYIWFCLYAGGIAGITALIVLRAQQASIPFLVSFAIPAMFLTMPIVEYYHLTLLMFSFAYLWASSAKSNKFLMISMLISIVMICSFFQDSRSFSITNGLFLIWAVLACQQVSAVTNFGQKQPTSFKPSSLGNSGYLS